MKVSDYIADVRNRLDMMRLLLEANGSNDPELSAEVLQYVYIVLTQVEQPLMTHLVNVVRDRMDEALQREADERTARRPGTPSPDGWQLGGRREADDPADGSDSGVGYVAPLPKGVSIPRELLEGNP